MITVADVIAALRQVAPERLQEDFDNTGLQIGDPTAECSGVLLCVDPTESVVNEAVARGCNLIVSHHPLFFKGIKSLVGSTPVERTALAIVRAGLSLYSCHTAIDNAPGGVSWQMARMLDVVPEFPLEQRTDAELGVVGSGVVGLLPRPMTSVQFVERVKTAFLSPVARCSAVPSGLIRRVAMCGGSGSFLIPAAIAAGAQAIITSDTRYHDFIDYASRIFIVDIGHFESENCTKELFLHTISEKFANFAIYKSETEQNPINYL